MRPRNYICKEKLRVFVLLLHMKCPIIENKSQRTTKGAGIMRRCKEVYYPEYKEHKYLIVDSEIYYNLAVQPGSIITARFLRETDCRSPLQRGR